MSRPYAEVIGDPIAHSKSPLIHSFWLGKLGMDAEYRASHVTRNQLTDYLRSRNADEYWRGCNVTIPHKRAVLPLLDMIDPSASVIGAVNTITVRDGYLHGYNTDAPGFMEPIAPMLESSPTYRFASLIGSGGAALAVGRALHDVGFTLIHYNRDPLAASARLGDLVRDKDLNCDIRSLCEYDGAMHDFKEGPDRFDLLVNATSLGMVGQPPLEIDLSSWPSQMVVYDIVYSPLETPLLAAARARGLRTIDGLQMLVGQAAAAFELFFGQPAPRQHDAELRALLTA